MIIIKLKKKIKSITQYIYSNIINSINFSEISCPNCQCTDWSYHAYYDRYVDLFDRCHKIRILRVRCNECDQTHAILIEDMIPYSIINYDLIYNITYKRDSFKNSHDFFIRNKYRDIVFSYEKLCLMNSRIQNQFKYISTQHLSGFFLFHVKVES